MIYKTIVTNQDGITGQLTYSDNQPLTTQHPLTDDPGYNPEQLVGSAWATCLNATIQTILAEEKIQARSQVTVSVELCKEKEEAGYYFSVKGMAAIESLDMDKAQKLVEKAHQRCPVSKLLGQTKTVELVTVPYSSNIS
ncbi:OsmC family protein [Streptococcus cameli]